MIMAALALCDAWIWVQVGIGKFLIDLDVTNIFYTKIAWSGSVLVSGLMAVSLHYNNRLNDVMD